MRPMMPMQGQRPMMPMQNQKPNPGQPGVRPPMQGQVFQAQQGGPRPTQEIEAKTADGKVFYSHGPTPQEVLDSLGAPRSQAMQEGKGDEFRDPDFGIAENFQVCVCCLFQVLIPCCYVCNQQTIQTYERGVVLRLGKKMHKGTLAGGLHLILPGIDKLMKIDVREAIIDIRPQKVITREGLNITIDSVLYYKVFDASRSILSIENLMGAITQIAQTKLRESLTLFTYEQIQLERKTIAEYLKRILDDATDPWGVDVTRVELTDLRLDGSLSAAMSQESEERRRAQALLIQAQGVAEVQLINANNLQKTRLIQAETEAKAAEITANAMAAAKVIEADGEKKAAHAFKNAATIMAQADGTMQLRFLQTMSAVGGSQGNTVMVPYDAAALQPVVNMSMS